MTNRKNTFISIFIVALTFAFGACSKDDENEAINNNEKTVYSNIHEYVDLGLPSGTLWATCNVGASKPEEFGEYFAWGETKPKDKYDWSTYKWCDGSYNTLTKYGFDNGYDKYGIVDNKERLDPEDDAATANWGVDWCMPSKEQFKELYNSSYTTTEWKAVNGVNGYIVNNQDEVAIQRAIDSISKIKPEACLESAKNYTYKNAAKTIYQILKGEKDE